MKKYTACLLASACTTVFTNESPILTPESITQYINANGAKATIDKFHASKDKHQWNTVMQKVATGNASWIAIAHKLADGADASSAESLQINLARALPNNPTEVLQLIDSKNFLGYADICGAPFIEPTHGYLMTYFTRTQKALNNLQAPKVEQQKKKCLSEIEKGLAAEILKD